MPIVANRAWASLGATLLLGWGCAKEPRSSVLPGSEVGSLATEEPVSSRSEPASYEALVDIEGFGTMDIGAEPDVVGEALAEGWCRTGGEKFRPPENEASEPDDGWPPRLDDCDEITSDAKTLQDGSGIVATVLTVDADTFETEGYVLLLLQSNAHAGLFELEHAVEMEESDGLDFEIVKAELRDVMGGPKPEIIIDTRRTGGDSFEADRCYAHDKDIGVVVVCTEDAEAFRCATVEYRYMDHLTARHDEECDMKDEELEEGGFWGHARDYELGDGVLRLTPADGADSVTEPEYTGDVPLTTLFEDAALEPMGAGRRSVNGE